MALMLLVLLGRLGWEYQHYRDFVAKPFYFTYAKVLRSYTKEKHGRRYQVLKLQSREGLQFYTTTHRTTPLHHTMLWLELFPDHRIGFWDYLGTFYVKSRIGETRPLPPSTREQLAQKIATQHHERMVGDFYSAILLASPLPPVLRQRVSAWGISHLVALSGFHLSILWGVLYAVLLLPYRHLQRRFFPYRYVLLDVGGVVMVLLGLFVWFVGMPPSLLRSYAMVVVGWALLLMGVELLSFSFLAVVFALLVVLSPALLVSLSFWLSVAGVFYIFLLLQYSQGYAAWVVMLGVIPVGIFVLMLPIVHAIFATTTLYQLFSPLLSLLFIPFYPLSIVLHLIGQGGLLDPLLSWLFTHPIATKEVTLPWWSVVPYIGLSLAAIVRRNAFGWLLGVALGVGVYLYVFNLLIFVE